MSRARSGWYVVVAILISVFTCVGGVLANVAANVLPDVLPEAWLPYLWLALPLSAISLVFTVVLIIWQTILEEKRKQNPVPTTEPIRPARPSLTLLVSRPLHNLPPRSDFVGREEYKARIHEALLQPRIRIISISGIGGVGKTALALEVAHECLQASVEETQVEGIARFGGFVWISAEDRDLTATALLDTIAQTLGYEAILREQPLSKKWTAIQLLQHEPCLIVLDSFENVANNAVKELLCELPEPTRVLVTTREQELIYDGAKPVSLDCLPREDAEKLILSEGERLDLKLKSLCYAENLQKLYASTKGLPLAIKWAMGQVKQKGQSLDRVLAALGSAQGDIFDDMFAHSWEMLLLTAQQILMVMPIFVVGASRDGIEAVSGLQSSAFDEALGQLVEMSLIARVEEDQLEQQSKQQRFSIHPLTRSFAWAKLKVHPEYPQMYDSARKRLAEFFEGYTGENGGLWNIAGFEQLTFDLPNIIAAIRWCWEQRLAELGTNILDNIRYYIMNHGSWNDALDLSYQAIAFVADLENNDDAVVARDEEWKLRAVRFRVWPIAWIYRFRNELEKAEEQVRQALRVFESLGEDSYIAYSKRHLGLVARDLGRPDDAKQLFQESLRFYQAANDLYRVHLLTADLATLALQDDLDRAYDLSRCVLDDPGQVTDKECIARFYRILGSVEYTRGNLDKARTFCENALAYSEKLKYRDGIADTLVELAEVEQKLGLEQLVHNRLMRAQQIYRELGIDNKVQEIARRLAGWTEESRHVVQ